MDSSNDDLSNRVRQHSTTMLKSPSNLIWYIEGRYSLHDSPMMGSAVVVRLRRKGEDKGNNYLLTCQHVLRRRQANRSGAWDEIAPEILAWSPGRGFTPATKFANRTLGECDGAFTARLSTIGPVVRDELQNEELRPSTDWVLLEVEERAFQDFPPVVRVGVVEAGTRAQIIGYPNGSRNWDTGDIVLPAAPEWFNVKPSDSPGSLQLTGPGESTQPGMSGGGVFIEGSTLIGLHRLRSGNDLRYGAVDVQAIRDELSRRNYEFDVPDPESHPTTQARASSSARLMPLKQIAAEVALLLPRLVQALQDQAKSSSDDVFLYSSNGVYGGHHDEPPSATVTAMAALALHQAHEPFSVLVVDALLRRQIREQLKVEERGCIGQRGSWPAQHGEHPHTMSTAWCLVACSQVYPGAINALHMAAEWLLNQRDARGLFPLYHGGQSSPFYTAYCLNALIEYAAVRKLHRFDDGDDHRFTSAIQSSLDALFGSAQTGPGNTLLFSNGQSDDACLATSSMVLHICRKMISMSTPISDQYRPRIRATHELLCEVLADGIGRPKISVPNSTIDLIVWPQINENHPAQYWFNYFAPVTCTTLLDIARIDMASSQAQSRFADTAVRQMVQWIVDNQINNGSGEVIGISRSLTDNKRSAIWSTAQSVMVLRRWFDALPEYFSSAIVDE